MNTTKSSHLFVVISTFLFLPSTALAASAGNFHGTATIVDGRNNPYEAAGMDNTPDGARFPTIGNGAAKPLKEGLIRVRAIGASESISFYGRTSTQGNYSISWAVPFDAVRVEVSALAHSPKTAGTTTSLPAARFRVSAVGASEIVLRTRAFTTGFNGTLDVDLNCSDTEAGRAYLTAREVHELWVNHGTVDIGGTIADQVTNLSININDADQSYVGNWGVTPSSEHIYLAPATTVFSWVVAHEIGHAVDWNALGNGLSSVTIGDYGWFDATFTWSEFSDEWQKVAFHDGFAHLHMATWMWYRDAQPTSVQGGPDPRIPCSSSGGCNLEVAGSCGPSGPATRDRRVMCVTRALWDFMDSPAGDDDGIINRDLSDFYDTFERYPSCNHNRCNRESYPWDQFMPDYADGHNWKDFKYHWVNENGSSSVAAIELANGLENSYDL